MKARGAGGDPSTHPDPSRVSLDSWGSGGPGMGSGQRAPAPSEPGRAPFVRRRAAPYISGPDPCRGPAPNEPNPPRRANPRLRAGRTQDSAPSEPGRPGFVRLGATPCGAGPIHAGARRRANPRPGAERTRDSPPSGPGPRCRANPGMRLSFAAVRPRAGRAARPPVPARRRLAPGGPGRRRRANPGVRLWYASVQFRAGRGRGYPTSDRPRPTCQRVVMPLRGTRNPWKGRGARIHHDGRPLFSEQHWISS